MKRLRPISAICLAGAIAGAAPAQSVPDDAYMLTATKGVFFVDRTTRQLSTITATQSGETYHGITMNAGNRAAALAYGSASVARLVSFDETNGLGAIVPTLPASTTPRHPILDQDGRLVFGADRALFKTAGLLNNAITTLVSGLPGSGVTALCLDEDNGDYVVAVTSVTRSERHLLRVDGRSGTYSTMAAAFGFVNDIAHDQSTGRFVAICSDAPNVRIIDGNGRTISSRVVNLAVGLHQDDVTGHVHVATGDGRILVFDRTLALLDQFGPFAGISFSDLTVWESRTFGPGSSIIHSGGKRGTKYALEGHFRDSPNRSYVCGISIGGLRPGVPLGDGRTINVKLDALFFASVQGLLPLFTSNFVGTTDSNGRFQASFIVPPLSTTSGMVFAIAGVVDPRQPSGLVIAPAIGIRVMP